MQRMILVRTYTIDQFASSGNDFLGLIGIGDAADSSNKVWL